MVVLDQKEYAMERDYSDFADLDYAKVEDMVIRSLADSVLRKTLRRIQLQADAAAHRHDAISVSLPGLPYTMLTNFQEQRN